LFRKSGLDKLGLINVFPSQIRTTERLEEHFKKAELGGVVDWYLNVGRLTEMMGSGEDSVEDVSGPKSVEGHKTHR
jgi:hypothetical protein